MKSTGYFFCAYCCISQLQKQTFASDQDNKTKILEHLRDHWTIDQRAEWSIWMIYSKVEMPHQYISAVDDSSYHGFHRRAPVLRKITEDVILSILISTVLF